jgi:hypothetical protein
MTLVRDMRTRTKKTEKGIASGHLELPPKWYSKA